METEISVRVDPYEMLDNMSEREQELVYELTRRGWKLVEEDE